MHVDSVEGFFWCKQRLLVQKKTLSCYLADRLLGELFFTFTHFYLRTNRTFILQKGYF